MHIICTYFFSTNEFSYINTNHMLCENIRFAFLMHEWFHSAIISCLSDVLTEQAWDGSRLASYSNSIKFSLSPILVFSSSFLALIILPWHEDSLWNCIFVRDKILSLMAMLVVNKYWNTILLYLGCGVVDSQFKFLLLAVWQMMFLSTKRWDASVRSCFYFIKSLIYLFTKKRFVWV